MKTEPLSTSSPLTWNQRFNLVKSRMRATPSFYTSSEKLSLSQRIHNVGSLCLRLPYHHRQYDEIDTKTFNRRRITALPSRFDPLMHIGKVALAAIFFPAICYLLSRPTAAEQSLAHIDHLWKGLTDGEKDQFLFAFLKNQDFTKDTNYAPLHLLAISYRESGLENEFILRLTQLEPLDTKIIGFQSTEMDEKLYIIASLALKSKKQTSLRTVFPLLSGNHQIKLLQECDRNRKVLRALLLPLATKAAQSHPAELLSFVIELDYIPASYNLGNSKMRWAYEDFFIKRWVDNIKRRANLYEESPRFVEVMNGIVPQLPTPSLFGIFWSFVNDDNMEAKFLHYEDLLETEKTLIRNSSYVVMSEFAKYDTSWAKLWYQLGPTDVQLEEACSSLTPGYYNQNQIFLNVLSHTDIYKLIRSDPTGTNLENIFGLKSIFGFSSHSDSILIPSILLRWWNLYENVDLKDRFDKFKTLNVNQKYTRHFQINQEFALSGRPRFENYSEAAQEEEKFLFENIAGDLDVIIEDPDPIKLAAFLDNLGDRFVEKLIEHIESKKFNFHSKVSRKQFLLMVHPDKVEKHMKNPSPLKSGVLTALMDLEKRTTETT